ncbi:60S ribosome biogenesis protein Rrp14 [Aspergillus costaricaensis CBS 115574]|uniref:60S ribosome biogenesis protein Rrp14 n=1 Tax=Aspergillus costaricaensis CBS 115574 TaxID=1448317 RepID=A0ACD1ID20_9EURO|nr:60S ribosome biogenesis protein Rrp14 [Aspergillus costaricaensis CBS 115574]RAK88134.1 60S ribosome biogenesis protein Rrp14 [Aspergillus costaricaensis CBS 115574]
MKSVLILLSPLCLSTILYASPTSTPNPNPPTVYLIRHGEKPPDPGDSGLNADGFKRAECLREVFGVGSPYEIGHVMAPKINKRGQHRRSYETVLPVAQDLGLSVDTSCKRNHVKCVAKRIREFKGTGNILISWRHGKMRQIVQELGYADPPEYPDDRFDLIWTIPFPYDNITEIQSEECPELDVPVPALLKVQDLCARAVNSRAETERQDFNLPTQFFRGIAAFTTFDRALPKFLINLQYITGSTAWIPWKERLRSHAQAFDGLLSLIPAKFYYGEDGSDQWQRKKQTKEQAREAKRAKLDPDSAKSAKDVMDENARKRKRDEEGNGEEDDSSDNGELGSEKPKEGLKRGDANSKKQKQAEDSADAERTPAKSAEEAEARKKLKEEKKAQKKAAQKEKKKAKEAARKVKVAEQPEETETPAVQKSESTPANKTKEQKQEQEDSDSDDSEIADGVPAEGLSLEFNAEQEEQPSSSASTPNSPGFDASNPQSGSSSISSIVPPTEASKSSTSEPKPLKPTPDELKQRLQKRLDELRAARHADGLNGKPARNRQELIEARRQKAEQRKAHKKELRQKAREEEQRLKDEAMVRRFSPGGSGSLLASPRSPADSVGSNNNYAFGRVVFADGQHADPTLSGVREQPKSHGPKDPAAALKAVEAKKAKLAAMDEQKRADIEEKDLWLNAKKRAHGERVRDDTSLLKKALKRKESAKKKSEREWKERLEAVKKGKDMKQQKREENLRKRREEKGNKGGGKKKQAGGGKKKSRPGFEGSFKAKSGGKK